MGSTWCRSGGARAHEDGNACPYVFTWSEDRSKWATGSGCSVFYNAALDGNPNTEMKRNLDGDTFEVYALRDIDADEEARARRACGPGSVG